MKKVLIIGGGLAGCYAAVRLQATCDVTIVTKGGREESNSMLAQGGIAAALDPGDSPAAHEADTLKAGVYHNRKKAVAQLVTVGPQLVRELLQAGMPFDRQPDGTLSFGLEGAHRHRRILHADGDRTGAALTRFVQGRLQTVTWVTHTEALALVQADGECRGVVVRQVPDGQPQVLAADAVVLATGGLGNLYDFTTNDHTVTGDGIALAARAGVALQDMAFVQFHPTLLALHGRCYGLITEAIRGAGAVLVDECHTPIMANVPQKDLAPRDVVARHLTAWQAQGHQLFLDISAVANFPEHFPGVTANLDRHHVPFRRDHLIPIQPGAHFMMGGVQADLAGQTSLPRLFAIGEVACNGVHGANRLASNSLLDCLVSAAKAADAIAKLPARTPEPGQTLPQVTLGPGHLPALATLQQRAWRELGVERTPVQLQDFLQWLGQFDYREINPAALTTAALTVANLCLCSELIATQALAQPSLGAHYLKEDADESSFITPKA
ncbi:MAG: FAD-dependent oxidoreductase [Lactobacillus sp.]|nr:FAD-dependent oxidoreductase [Lactobacillus sp.]MCI2033649.1 FAD-dependent oxidoreductase [Lactobacillus sp.]